MAYKNTGVYSSEKEYKEAMTKEAQLRKEIQDALIATAPTEELKEAIRSAVVRSNENK